MALTLFDLVSKMADKPVPTSEFLDDVIAALNESGRVLGNVQDKFPKPETQEGLERVTDLGSFAGKLNEQHQQADLVKPGGSTPEPTKPGGSQAAPAA